MTILYSFRRCPYAMRSRLALSVSELPYEHREVSLKAKPVEMLALSPKATVPVFQCDNGTVLEESLDIMHWALSVNDPEHWLPQSHNESLHTADLIATNDGPFKTHLDKYKYAVRYPEASEADYRSLNIPILEDLEACLNAHRYLVAERVTLADMAIFPFVRQFAHVDSDWFFAQPWPWLHAWLQAHLASDRFQAVMKKHPLWLSPSSEGGV